MYEAVIKVLQTLNEILTAGITITAVSLLFYALTFNLRDRVARSFALILICVVIVFVGDTISSTITSITGIEFWLGIQWIGIAFLPAAYLHFSDAILATTGRPSRGWRRILARMTYVISLLFLLTLPFGLLVGPLVVQGQPAPHLQRTWFTWVFTGFYAAAMLISWLNFWQAYERTVTRTSRRRMQYLLTGALAPAIGSYPYLLFGSSLASAYPMMFWFASITSNLVVYGLLVVMAYSVAYFGVPWPDRVVKRRLIKWLMRGPVTASAVLGIVTLTRRAGLAFGFEYTAAVPLVMVGSILIIEHAITLTAPVIERIFLAGGDRANMQMLSRLEERLLTVDDLRQFLESVLAAVMDRVQVSSGFLVVIGENGLEMVVTIGEDLLDKDLSTDFQKLVSQNGFGRELFHWGEYWLVPLFEDRDEEPAKLLGLIGFPRLEGRDIDEDHLEALNLMSQRAALAVADRSRQQQLVSSLQQISPQMERIQRLRAASQYDGSNVLASAEELPEDADLARMVKDALSHYWGGPKLTNSPLLNLRIVQDALEQHEGNPTKALRAILNQAIEKTRPEGERRFTGEWILFNILEMKFLEGKKVREIAMRLAMSEADLYRKQRVAIEAVANSIVEMEQKACEDSENYGEKSLS